MYTIDAEKLNREKPEIDSARESFSPRRIAMNHPSQDVPSTTFSEPQAAEINEDSPDRHRQRLKRRKRVGLLLLLLFGLWFFWPRPVKISEETTRWTKPVDASGLIDYAAVYQRRASEGVTPENNAAVPLVEQMGVDRLLEVGLSDVEDELAAAGVALEAAREGGFVDLETWFLERGITAEDLPELNFSEGNPSAKELARVAMLRITQPWNPGEMPPVSRWVSFHRGVLRELHEASRRARLYLPLEMDEGEVLLDAESIEMHLRMPLKLLLARAMQTHDLNEDSGRTERKNEEAEAWADLAALARLGALYGNIPHTYDWLVGHVILEDAYRGIIETATRADWSEKSARDHLRRFRELPRPLPAWEVIDFWERMLLLDWAARLADHEGFEKHPGAFFLRHGIGMDRNVLLRRANAYFDALVPIAQMQDYHQRRLRWESFRETLQEEGHVTWWKIFHPFGLSRTISDIFIDLTTNSIFSLLETEVNEAVLRNLAETALALEAYRATVGEYPESLAELVPDDLEAVPRDGFGDGPLKYECTGDGYLMYSIGLNGGDDRGDPVDGKDLVVLVGDAKDTRQASQVVD